MEPINHLKRMVKSSFIFNFINLFLNVHRLGMNAFQKNPKHASVLAERFVYYVTI